MGGACKVLSSRLSGSRAGHFLLIVNIIGDEIPRTQAAGEGRDRSRMADFEDRLRKFLAHYDELERNQETEDGFIKEFMVRFR